MKRGDCGFYDDHDGEEEACGERGDCGFVIIMTGKKTHEG